MEYRTESTSSSLFAWPKLNRETFQSTSTLTVSWLESISAILIIWWQGMERRIQQRKTANWKKKKQDNKVEKSRDPGPCNEGFAWPQMWRQPSIGISLFDIRMLKETKQNETKGNKKRNKRTTVVGTYTPVYQWPGGWFRPLSVEFLIRAIILWQHVTFQSSLYGNKGPYWSEILDFITIIYQDYLHLLIPSLSHCWQ